MRCFVKLLHHTLIAWWLWWISCVVATAPAAELIVAGSSSAETQGLQAAILDYRRLHGVAIDIEYVPRRA